MSWRIVTLQNSARLSLRGKQLVINQKSEEFTFPIEDLCVVILESLQVTITSAVLSCFQEHNVILVTCDEKHTPNGLLHGLYSHSRQTQISHLQKKISVPLQKRLWQFIIQQKIKNQAKCLELFSLQNVQEITRLYYKVESGDRLNIESQVARIYWPSLFGSDFKRHQGCIVNSALNYAYSILRSLMCRGIVSYGLIPCFGIHHKNELNAFNLADDLIEPFRPIIDSEVKRLMLKHCTITELTQEIREELISLSFMNCIIANEVHVLHKSVEKVASSFVKALREKTPSALQLPFLSA